MSNNYFQFKQFRIDQEKSAMKVTTEGCLLGALAGTGRPRQILDIGSGTGLLALMLAQQTEAQVTTVEADEDSYNQTYANISNSPWSDRVFPRHATIQEFAASCDDKFDLIVSNPPFYTNYLQSDDLARNLAKHTYSLSMSDLLAVVKKLLQKNGLFYVLYPPYEAGVFARLAEREHLYPNRNVIIRNRPDGSIFRMITAYGRDRSVHEQSELVIRENDQEYSSGFKQLMKDFYLAF